MISNSINDLPDDLKLVRIASQTEFMGLNVKRDLLCLVQISNGSLMLIVQFDRENYNAPNLVKILADQ